MFLFLNMPGEFATDLYTLKSVYNNFSYSRFNNKKKKEKKMLKSSQNFNLSALHKFTSAG